MVFSHNWNKTNDGDEDTLTRFFSEVTPSNFFWSRAGRAANGTVTFRRVLTWRVYQLQLLQQRE